MWWAYIQYESGVSCKKVGNCFTKDSIVSNRDGYDYFNVVNFAELNLIDRDTLLIIYWTMFAFGIFWIFGTPVQILMAIVVNSMMTFNVFYNYQITLQGD